ncbi:MAG: VOC family protein, partial [Rhodoferax sp.]|nr:VOC family protein [Rhodoferax sp.]
MLNYITLGSNNIARSVAFYDAVLAPLGLTREAMAEDESLEDWVGWGPAAEQGAFKPSLWVCKPFNGQAATAGNGVMVALGAASWQAVRAVYQAAMNNGGSSEGEPGLRPQYGND